MSIVFHTETNAARTKHPAQHSQQHKTCSIIAHNAQHQPAYSTGRASPQGFRVANAPDRSTEMHRIGMHRESRQKKTPKNRGACGASRVRTGDPLLAKQMRYQLRHSPECIEICKVGPGGLEPPTSSLSGMRSNHLSYGPLCFHTSGYLTPNLLSVNSRQAPSACRAPRRGFPRLPHRIHAPRSPRTCASAPRNHSHARRSIRD